MFIFCQFGPHWVIYVFYRRKESISRSSRISRGSGKAVNGFLPSISSSPCPLNPNFYFPRPPLPYPFLLPSFSLVTSSCCPFLSYKSSYLGELPQFDLISGSAFFRTWGAGSPPLDPPAETSFLITVTIYNNHGRQSIGDRRTRPRKFGLETQYLCPAKRNDDLELPRDWVFFPNLIMLLIIQTV